MSAVATPPTPAATHRTRGNLAAVLAVLLRDDYSAEVDEPRVIDGYLATHPASLAAASEQDDD